ncbi:hypothetical protein MBLNU457_7548t1 [Dothideomycetes sp. NU457]
MQETLDTNQFTPLRTKSILHETGLDYEHAILSAIPERPPRQLRFRSKPDVFEYTDSELSDDDNQHTVPIKRRNPTQARLQFKEHKMAQREAARAANQRLATLYRLGAGVVLLAILVPLLHGYPWTREPSIPKVGVQGGVIRRDPNPIIETEIVKRDNSPTDVCTRWAQQSALVNGTLYIYGGQASTSPGQEANTWNNDFLTLDLTSDWQISTPSLTGLPQPSGPPAIALGALWNSHQSLYVYGGEYSSNPPTTPAPFALWEYNIAQSRWFEHNNPTTSSGQNSGPDGQPVQRSAEGAGVSVPSLGRAWYFGGHQDGYTTPGWSQSIYRIYLQSLLEFTFPSFTNNQVYALSDGKTAGTDGNYRNITEGGTQNTAGFPERADGLLLYVPGFGADGILIGLAGGTNTTFQQMNEVDVFDIAASEWYKQSTSGPAPQIRVNPCGVVAAAPDGSSYNVYMFGGQNLQPAAAQTQYNDMWILTIPSFTWIQVDQGSQAVPYARAGHTCNIWNGQMVVVGGYVGTQLSCDSPGVYVYDLSNLKWLQKYSALSGKAGASSGSGSSSSSSDSDSSSDSSAGSSAGSASPSGAQASSPSSGSKSSSFTSNQQTNPFNQQVNQLANGSSPGGLEGSYGYSVPGLVQSVIGGNSQGGATITAPAQTATAGPLVSGKPITYTVTQSNGATVTETGTPSGNGGTNTNTTTNHTNIAAIIAPSVIAAILLLVVCYLAFCAWLYRKRVNIYKRHIDMTRQTSYVAEEKPFFSAGAAPFTFDSAKTSQERRRLEAASSNQASDSARHGSNAPSGSGNGSGSGHNANPFAYGAEGDRRSSGGSAENLLGGSEPTFWGTMLAPRRSLRVINRD